MNKNRFLKSAAAALLCLLLAGCGKQAAASLTGEEAQASPAIAETVSQAPSGKGKLRISELMSKNNSTITDAGGEFKDWFELENISGEELDLSSWSVGDSSDGPSQPLEGSVAPGGHALFFAENFGLKRGDTLYVYDAQCAIVASAEVNCDTPDFSDALDEDGVFQICKYPTPGLPNTIESYVSLQESHEAVGPLAINEVCVENFSNFYNELKDDYPDWIELINVSASPVSLKDYCLSDDNKDFLKAPLPDRSIMPGECLVLLCSKDPDYKSELPVLPIALDSESDSLFLSTSDGTPVDFTPLKDIPYGKTFGRVEGENGFFYLLTPTPGQPNSTGCRYVAASPVSKGDSGVFNGISSVKVELSGKGEIRYTLDSTVPTADSELYTGPFEVNETCIVRAVAFEDGAIESRPLTLSYILNENHDLPVVSLVSDNKAFFRNMYAGGYKTDETPCSVSYYGPDGTFTLGCGVKLHGDTSLILFKPGMSLRFRGAYGQKKLNYDLFGGGETSFSNLLLRGCGQDQNNTIVRNELVMNLAMNAGLDLVCERNRYCVVYIDGVYKGIHSLMEKTNEQLYASLKGVSKDSVIENTATVYSGELFYQEVIDPVLYGDMRDPAQYKAVTEVLDIDSLIDWAVVEGWCENTDLASGNLRYYKSSEGDGLWRLALYDLDVSFAGPYYCFTNVFNFPTQIASILSNLSKNEDFRTRFLQRASELMSTSLTDEAALAELDRLCAEIDSETERDGKITFMSRASWLEHVDSLRSMLSDNWTAKAINNLCSNVDCLHITAEERAEYFGK